MIKEVAVIICVVVVLLLVLCAVLLSRVTQTGGAPTGRRPKTTVGGAPPPADPNLALQDLFKYDLFIKNPNYSTDKENIIKILPVIYYKLDLIPAMLQGYKFGKSKSNVVEYVPKVFTQIYFYPPADVINKLRDSIYANNLDDNIYIDRLISLITEYIQYESTNLRKSHITETIIINCTIVVHVIEYIANVLNKTDYIQHNTDLVLIKEWVRSLYAAGPNPVNYDNFINSIDSTKLDKLTLNLDHNDNIRALNTASAITQPSTLMTANPTNTVITQDVTNDFFKQLIKYDLFNIMPSPDTHILRITDEIRKTDDETHDLILNKELTLDKASEIFNKALKNNIEMDYNIIPHSCAQFLYYDMNDIIAMVKTLNIDDKQLLLLIFNQYVKYIKFTLDLMIKYKQFDKNALDIVIVMYTIEFIAEKMNLTEYINDSTDIVSIKDKIRNNILIQKSIVTRTSTGTPIDNRPMLVTTEDYTPDPSDDTQVDTDIIEMIKKNIEERKKRREFKQQNTSTSTLSKIQTAAEPAEPPAEPPAEHSWNEFLNYELYKILSSVNHGLILNSFKYRDGSLVPSKYENIDDMSVMISKIYNKNISDDILSISSLFAQIYYYTPDEIKSQLYKGKIKINIADVSTITDMLINILNTCIDEKIITEMRRINTIKVVDLIQIIIIMYAIEYIAKLLSETNLLNINKYFKFIKNWIKKICIVKTKDDQQEEFITLITQYDTQITDTLRNAPKQPPALRESPLQQRVQPVPAAHQPVPAAPAAQSLQQPVQQPVLLPVPAAHQPVPAAHQPVPAAQQPAHQPAQPVQQPVRPVQQPVQPAQQPAPAAQPADDEPAGPAYWPGLPAGAFLDSEFDSGFTFSFGPGGRTASINPAHRRPGRPVQIVFTPPAADLPDAWVAARAAARVCAPGPVLIFVPRTPAPGTQAPDDAALLRGVRAALRTAGRLVPGRTVANPAPGDLFWLDSAGLNRIASSGPR